MALNIVAEFFSLINASLFDSATVLLIASFLIWEIPRTVKILSEEYTRGVYPEFGRMVDIVLMIVGLGAVFILMTDLSRVIAFLKTPGIISFFVIILVVIPLIIVMGFFKRFFQRIDEKNSLTVFLAHSFLDLMHTLFYVSLTILVIPAFGFLLFSA